MDVVLERRKIEILKKMVMLKFVDRNFGN